MEEALSQLEAMEKSSAPAEVNAPTAPEQRDAEPAPRATEPVKTEAQNFDSKAADTRATTEAKTVAPEQNKSQTEAKPPEAPKVETKAEAEKSRYAKSQERLTKTWETVNADKAAIAADKAKLETERAEFARKQAEFQAIQQSAAQPQFKPEDYQTAAQQKRQLADHQRAQARRLEEAGQFAEAEKLVKLAAKNDALSEDLTEHAETLKKNPPAGFAQKEQQYQQAKQAWTVEAAKAFPELVQEGSSFQKTVAGHLNALAKSDPQLLANPSVIYHVARLTAAEAKAQSLQADAARVPVLVKEAEELRAKIKELEALTTPAGAGSAARLGNDAGDSLDTLRQEAEAIGSIR